MVWDHLLSPAPISLTTLVRCDALVFCRAELCTPCLASAGRFDQFLKLRAERQAKQRNLFVCQEKKRERLQSTIAQV